jgi:hypothetical protein
LHGSDLHQWLIEKVSTPRPKQNCSLIPDLPALNGATDLNVRVAVVEKRGLWTAVRLASIVMLCILNGVVMVKDCLSLD